MDGLLDGWMEIYGQVTGNGWIGRYMKMDGPTMDGWTDQMKDDTWT